ncbi:MAG: PadR family transcriptional regulator [Candidatus Bathyarchaeota archaeon]|nr:MAG: PadR family transcriptional regulator [Candidatus Bathyarchaeota archaeon]
MPKGFLRYYVLRLLDEKPMSGSEIMTEIETRTHGHWKPSPGSIYPLLSWLQDKEYSQEVTDPEKEPGIKRYILTEKGKAMLEEHVKRRRELRKRTGFFPSPFMGPPWLPHITEETSGLLEAGKRLAMSSWALLDNLHEKLSEDVVAKATEVLTDAAKQIEKMTKELHNQKDD